MTEYYKDPEAILGMPELFPKTTTFIGSKNEQKVFTLRLHIKDEKTELYFRRFLMDSLAEGPHFDDLQIKEEYT